jgi:hypothetical protein
MGIREIHRIDSGPIYIQLLQHHGANHDALPTSRPFCHEHDETCDLTSFWEDQTYKLQWGTTTTRKYSLLMVVLDKTTEALSDAQVSSSFCFNCRPCL